MEKGELNILATGMAGDIEYCSIGQSNLSDDKFPLRLCPKCTDQTMKKVNLLRLSDLIFDYCEHCGSFFLDNGEINLMNEELRKLVPDGVAQEYRGYHENHLVRVDRRNGGAIVSVSGDGSGGYGIRVVSIRISVYFITPLATKLRVFQEHWYAKLFKAFSLFIARDIPTGDAKFDRLFRVQGDDEGAIVSILNPAFRREAVKFAIDKPRVLSSSGSLDISRHLISYTEGPYKEHLMPPVARKAGPLMGRLLELAKLLDA